MLFNYGNNHVLYSYITYFTLHKKIDCVTTQPFLPDPLNNPGGNFTDWEEWTECSMTCGGGKRARRRRCQLLEDGTSVNCFGVTLQIGDCFTGPCPG